MMRLGQHRQRARRGPRRRLVGIAVVLLVGGGILVSLNGQHTFGLRTEAFTFASGGNELAGTLHRPTDDGPHGVVVFVPGDGTADADPGAFPVWEAFARAGYATVQWDKPGVGDSTGNWLDQDMADRAGEVVDVIDALADRADLDVGNVGVMGASQGGWVLPLVAERISVDFFVAWSPAVNWIEQGRFLTERELDAAGADADLRNRVRRADISGDNAMGRTYAEYLRWHDALDGDVQAFFGRMSPDRWRFVVRNADLDARHTLPAMSGTPVLLLLGGRDDHVDVDDTERVYRRVLGEPCLEISHYPEGDHRLLDQEGIGLVVGGILHPRDIFADGMIQDLERFANGPHGC